MRAQVKEKLGERGSAVVEFVLSSLVWLPALLGTAIFGCNLIFAIQVSALSRDAGHMFAYGVDFSQAGNQPLLLNLASPLGIAANSGNGAIMLSTITYITDIDCGNAPCSNRGKYVFTKLIVFGDRSLIKSGLGTPPISTIGSTGVLAVTTAQYLNDSRFLVTAFPGLLAFPSTTQPGQIAYSSEVWLQPPTLSWSAFPNTGSYARTIF